MYGIGRKNDIYKKSKWSSDTDSKSLKSKSDLDINSESEYEESKSEVYEKPVSNNDYFSKIFALLNEIKTSVDKNEKCEKQICQIGETPNTSDKLSLEKLDNILEYIKTIDSDSKNTFELLKHINKSQEKSEPSDDEGFTTDQLKEIIKSELMNNKTASELDDHIISLITNHYNKIRLKMDNIPSKLDIIHGDVDILYNKIDYINQNQTQLLNIINKLTSDNLFLRIQLEQNSQKLDKLMTSVDYLHQSKISTINPVIYHTMPEKATHMTTNTQNCNTLISNTSVCNNSVCNNSVISKKKDINTIDMINNIDCTQTVYGESENNQKDNQDNIEENNENIEEYISVTDSGSQEGNQDNQDNQEAQKEENENIEIENKTEEMDDIPVEAETQIKSIEEPEVINNIKTDVINNINDIKNVEEIKNIDIKIEIPDDTSDQTFFKPASVRSVTKRIVRKKK